MNNDELVQVFGINRESNKKRFFMDRHIKDKMIAEWLEGVSSMSVGRWLKDNTPIPDKYKSRMELLKQAIIQWEIEHGRMFNHFINPPTPKKTSPPTLKNR